MDRLLAIGLVERVVPVTEDPSRTKRAVYRIADNFLNFWFRFVYRQRADIARGLGREILNRVVIPGLADYMVEPWEGCVGSSSAGSRRRAGSRLRSRAWGAGGIDELQLAIFAREQIRGIDDAALAFTAEDLYGEPTA